MNIFQAITHTVASWVTAFDGTVLIVAIMASTVAIIGSALVMIVVEEKN